MFIFFLNNVSHTFLFLILCSARVKFRSSLTVGPAGGGHKLGLKGTIDRS